MVAVPTPSDTFKGIACMIGGVATLTLNDGVMKWMTASYPVGEIIFIRGLFARTKQMNSWHTLAVYTQRMSHGRLH